MDLLPRDAESARRAAGGDGAAFVRLYDQYSEDLFQASLAASGSVETAAKATQTAFLRILRRPPALDAPDAEVAARLRRLVPDGPIDPAPASNGGGHHRAIDVGWLRSETVAKAGARFDDDWGVHLWNSPPASRAEEHRPPEPHAEHAGRRRRFALPRRARPPRVAAAALVGLTLLGGALGTLVTGGGQSPSGAVSPAAASEEPAKPQSGASRPDKPRTEWRGVTKTRLLAMKPCRDKEQSGSC